MPFALFRLPYLPIVQVFKHMSHETLFLLSISTRKAKDFIRIFLPKHFLTAHFHFCGLVKLIPGPGHFRIYGLNTDDWPKKAIRCQIGNHLAAVHLAAGQIDFYWSRQDLQLAISNFFAQMKVCWNYPKISVTLDGSYELEQIFILMEDVKRNNLEIESVCLLKNQNHGYGNELVKYMVECMDTTSKLVIDFRIDGFFEHDGHSRNSIRVKEFEIRNCGWVFLEDFMNCQSIKMECVNIQNNFGVYINTFIQKWMNDYECQLKIVTITNCPFAFEQITNGLMRKKSSRSVKDISLKLQRDDGKHILITLNEGVLKIELTN